MATNKYTNPVPVSQCKGRILDHLIHSLTGKMAPYEKHLYIPAYHRLWDQVGPLVATYGVSLFAPPPNNSRWVASIAVEGLEVATLAASDDPLEAICQVIIKFLAGSEGVELNDEQLRSINDEF
jgi:hypothetical protein